MTTVWKFPLRIVGLQEIRMPRRTIILTAQMQHTELCLWAVCVEGKTNLRTIEIFGTGHELPDFERAYIATVQTGGLVWHIFERIT